MPTLVVGVVLVLLSTSSQRRNRRLFGSVAVLCAAAGLATSALSGYDNDIVAVLPMFAASVVGAACLYTLLAGGAAVASFAEARWVVVWVGALRLVSLSVNWVLSVAGDVPDVAMWGVELAMLGVGLALLVFGSRAQAS